jgi:hypothetical protein
MKGELLEKEGVRFQKVIVKDFGICRVALKK